MIINDLFNNKKQGMAEGSEESYMIIRTDAEGKKDMFAKFSTYEKAQKELDVLLDHPLHTKYKQKFEIKRKGGEQGVAEGFSLKKTNVDKYMEPGDPDEYTQDVNIKDTDYEIINNKTGQVVGTASWTTNDFMGPGALKITMKNGATRWLDIWASEQGNPQSAFNRFVKDPKTAKKYKEQGVAEVSKATLDRYVPKAVDAHGHADFGARQSKDDPTLRSYHKSQKHTAEKRRQGISRALDRMSKTEGVAEDTQADSQRKQYPNYYQHKDAGTIFRIQNDDGTTRDITPDNTEEWNDHYRQHFPDMTTPNDGGFWNDDNTAAYVEGDGFDVVNNYADMRTTDTGNKSNQTYTSTTIQKNPATGQQKSLAKWDHTDPKTGKNYSGSNYIDAQGNAEVQKNYEESKNKVNEVSLGDYRKKAAVSQAGAKIDRFFGRDNAAKVAAADQTIAKRERGLARADTRTRPYTPPPHDAEKYQRDLTAKYPNIDELVRRAELNRDPDYEMADGQAYYAARDAEQNYQKLRQIQRVIQGLNESLQRTQP